MSKPFSADEDQIKHFVLPEVTGEIVGLGGDSLRPQTVEDIEKLQQQAFEEGRAEGRRAGVAEMAEQARKLANMFNFFNKPLATLDEEVERQLTQLALSVARQIIKRECRVDVATVQSVIHEALDYLPLNSRNVRVRLNPADIALLREADIDTSAQEWACVADKSVAQGGCLIESETSHVDASIETRIEKLAESLDDQRPQYDDES